ncbi:MAG: hypothetical protein ACRC33_06315 [Gemmataceae bacterium]
MPTALLLMTLCFAADKPDPKVYVILWFDTEDYLLPASDDAALWVADFLTRQKIRGTFKVVGEKARTLARRKRDDVIAALKKHEIGYHSDYHSVHPTPAMYLSNLGWDEGVEEFDRREGKGWRDVERVFGQKPTCYGQPGSSWGPQSYGALARWGMIYLDSGSHVSLDGKPCYFGGVFNLYRLEHTIRADLNKPEDLEKAFERFSAARKDLLAEGGGVVSIVYHPCEWVHKQFWDGVNFSKGANPPREKWVKPPQKTEAETKVSKKVFADYVAYMQRFKDVEFITASQAAKLYQDRLRTRKFNPVDLRRVAAKVADGVTYQVHDEYALSAAEVFTLLNGYVALKAADLKVKMLPLPFSPLGPTSRLATMAGPVTCDGSQFGRTAEDVEAYVGRHKRLPGTVWLGSVGVTPEAYLRAVAKVALELLDGRPIPAAVTVQPTALLAEKYVSADDPKLWGWVIFPPGFRAPAMMDLARRQAWTLKPALLRP